MASKKAIKIIGLIATGVGLAANLVSSRVSDKKMEDEIEAKVMKSTALIYFNKAKYKTIKHAPEIMAVVGGVGAVVGVVLACKATLKVHDILEETKSDLNDIHEVSNDPKFDGIYTEESAKKDTATVYVRAVYHSEL